MGDTRQDLWQMILSLKILGEHLVRSTVPEIPKACHIPWGAQQP